MTQPLSLEALAAQLSAAPAPAAVPYDPSKLTPEQRAYLDHLASLPAPGPVNPPEATPAVVAQSIAPVPAAAPNAGPQPIGGAPTKGPSKAEIVAQLKARDIPFRTSQSKDELAALLANPPAIDRVLNLTPVTPIAPGIPVSIPVTEAVLAAISGGPTPTLINPEFPAVRANGDEVRFFTALGELQSAAAALDLLVEISIK